MPSGICSLAAVVQVATMDSRTLILTVSFNALPSPHAASASDRTATDNIRFMAFPLLGTPEQQMWAARVALQARRQFKTALT